MSDNFKYVQSQATTLAGAGASIGDTTLTLTSFLQIDGSTTLTMTNFGSVGFGTIEPGGGTNEEQISFTGITQNSNGTATLTGVKTVLFISPYTQTSGMAKSHAGGTTFVVSNTAGFYDEFLSKDNDETVVGLYTFPNGANTPTLGSSYVAPTASNQVASKGYVDTIAIAGAPNASTVIQGLVQEATQAQVDAKTSTGSTGAKLFQNISTQRSTLLNDYVADSGAADAYVITPSPAITAYAVGQQFSFKATSANTGASTLNVSTLGTKSIKKMGSGTALVANDILAGQIVNVEYDGTQFQMLNPSGRDFVDVTTAQTVAGVKTFSSSPISPTPTTATQVAIKSYVDARSLPLAVRTSQQALGANVSETDVIGNTSVLGGSLSSGRAIRFEAIFIATANTGSVTMKLYYGGSSVGSLALSWPANNNSFVGHLVATIAYVGASSQYVSGMLTGFDTQGTSAAASSAFATLSTTSAVDESAAQNVKLTATGSANETVFTIQSALIHLI